MLVADGLGGLPMTPGGKDGLETAKKPNLDALAKIGVQGGSIPVFPGISPGSGPGHLGLFGYDPIKYLIGRGALEATGIGFAMQPGDVAARGNFCTLDAAGKISDRRAGRIPTEESAPLAIRLREVKIPGYEIFVEPVKEHRFVVVFRGPGLEGNVKDTDPQAVGVPPLAAEAQDAAIQQTAQVASQWIAAATKLLAGEKKASGLTLRGFAGRPNLPSYEEVYGLQPRRSPSIRCTRAGPARRHGDRWQGPDAERADRRPQQNWGKYDFFFIHFNYTDSTGGASFDAKVKRIEELDAIVPRIIALKPNVLIVTGDHSTPVTSRAGWHPCPRCSPATAAVPTSHATFGERMRSRPRPVQAKYLTMTSPSPTPGGCRNMGRSSGHSLLGCGTPLLQSHWQLQNEHIAHHVVATGKQPLAIADERKVLVDRSIPGSSEAFARRRIPEHGVR
jgi:2,3-bisphosphoglycerate-independent phosphoglycerate mutase